MNREEALEIIENYNPPKPFKYYYNDPYRDGYQDSSGWVYEYPPVSGSLIDAILERDKDCETYITDDEIGVDEDGEKFNAEMEKRFTDLVNRGKENNTVIEEYRKKNSHLYSMVTEYKGEKITVIPMKMSTKCEFNGECEKASSRLGLANYSICVHKDDNDSGREILTRVPHWNIKGLTSNEENAIYTLLSFCEYFSKYSDRGDSEYKESISNICNEVKTVLLKLKLLVTSDYLQRIKNYIAKEQLNSNNEDTNDTTSIK